MGSCKQLLSLGDKPVIVRCIEAMIRAQIPEIVVVVGPNSEAIIDVIAGFPVTIARNEEPESDMAESVRIGLGSIDRPSKGVIVALTDHPLVKSTTYSFLLECHRIAPGRIIIPVYAEKKGHPTLFPRAVIEELEKPLTLRDLIRRYSNLVLPVPVPDIGVALDMDTREDYDRLRKMFYSPIPRKPISGSNQGISGRRSGTGIMQLWRDEGPGRNLSSKR